MSGFAPMRKVAEAAAREAGGIMRAHAGRRIEVTNKGEIDLVTEVDLACEKAIVARIAAAFPEHGILAEEGEGRNPGATLRWIVDPLDGTTNYAHRFPYYCASVAFADEQGPAAGAVYDPERDELFAAVRGEGATLNGAPIGVSAVDRLTDGLLATGFPYSIRTTPQNNFAPFMAMALKAQAIRRPGAAALDLCYVAAGRLDGFWEYHLKPWDMAAGGLIVAEAGGRVTMSDGSPFTVTRSDIVASNGPLHDAMLAVLARAEREGG